MTIRPIRWLRARGVLTALAGIAVLIRRLVRDPDERASRPAAQPGSTAAAAS